MDKNNYNTDKQITKRELFDKVLFLRKELSNSIIGQQKLLDCLITALFAKGHILVEGPPGLAKTTTIRMLAKAIDAQFHRIQFTPDLLPSDITGSEIYKPQDSSFEFVKGVIFNQMILADEINRSPAKVQSALLEAMEERQVTVGNHSYKLPDIFMVMATQNPIDQQGTYQLPEAQMDRFLMKVKITYPNISEEKKIMNLILHSQNSDVKTHDGIMDDIMIRTIQKFVFDNIFVSESIKEYIVQLIGATRNFSNYDKDFGSLILYGASPRGTLALNMCSRVVALLNDRDFVIPDDVQYIFHEVLRHRVALSFEAEADGIDSDFVLNKILQSVPPV